MKRNKGTNNRSVCEQSIASGSGRSGGHGSNAASGGEYQRAAFPVRIAAILALTLLPFFALTAQSTGTGADGKDASDGESGLDESDIFAEGAFDQEVEATTSAEAGKAIEWLFGVSMVNSTGLFVLPDPGASAAQMRLYGKAFLKGNLAELGSVFASISYDQLLLLGSGDEDQRTLQNYQEPNLSEPKLALSELYYSFDFGKIVFVRVGSQLLGWSVARVWSPADFVNIQVQDSSAPVDVRSGKPGVRIHVPFTGGNLFAFVDFSQTVRDNPDTVAIDPSVTDPVETTAYAARVDATLFGVNVGVQAYGGMEAPVRLGATISGSALGADLWAEFGSRLETNDYEAAWALSVGGERTFGTDKEWAIRAEYFHQSDGHDDTDLSTLETGTVVTPLYWGNDYVFLEFENNKLIGSVLGAKLGGKLNISDLSYQISGTMNFAFSKTLPFIASLAYNGGPDNREFTYRGGKPSLNFGLTAVLNL